MDPMTQLEEERRLKAENELKELHETLVLDEEYFAVRDLLGKGRDVHPSGKQRKMVQTVAATIKFPSNSKRKSNGFPGLGDDQEGEDSLAITEIDLTMKPRTYITSGSINKHEPDKFLRKIAKKYLFIFSDLILLTNKKDGCESFEVQQVIFSNINLSFQLIFLFLILFFFCV